MAVPVRPAAFAAFRLTTCSSFYSHKLPLNISAGTKRHYVTPVSHARPRKC